jgi:tetratricopeptide (TPR) repeat protein
MQEDPDPELGRTHPDPEQEMRAGLYRNWQQQPQSQSAFETLANWLYENGKVSECLQVCAIGIKLFPADLGNALRYGDLLNSMGEYEACQEHALSILTRHPGHPASTGILGNALRGLGCLEQAADCFRKVLKHLPGHPQASFNLSTILLQQGDWEGGWIGYESRFQLPGYRHLIRRAACPRWQGQSLEGKRLLVYAEQGLGDSLQFLRYLPWLCDMNAGAIKVEVQSALLPLLQEGCALPVQWIARNSPDAALIEGVNYQIPLLSLPLIAKQQGIHCPPPPLNIRPPEAGPRVTAFLANTPAHAVGLCWQGNPHAAIDAGRSIPGQVMNDWLAKQPTHFVSLQARDAQQTVEALARQHRNFHYLPGLDQNVPPFFETAALMTKLKCILTTDTSIAHLAGCLAVPTSILLQKTPEWRWGTADGASAWYPNATCLRQIQRGDWPSLLQKISAMLPATGT